MEKTHVRRNPCYARELLLSKCSTKKTTLPEDFEGVCTMQENLCLINCKSICKFRDFRTSQGKSFFLRLATSIEPGACWSEV